MNTKRLLTMVIFVVGLLLTLSVGLGAARVVQENPPPVDPASVSAAVNLNIPVQGRLTNIGGSPLDGDYKLTFRVYSVQTGGNAICTDSHIVNVDNGLFNTAIKGCKPEDINGQQLYIGVEVESDGEMKPRQPLYPVPYAISLVQGARLSGSLNNQAMLEVANKHPDGAAIKLAGPLVSTDRSVIFIPGNAIVKVNQAEPITIEMIVSSRGRAKIEGYGPASTETQYVVLPITIPGVLYGQNVKIMGVKIYYSCESASSHIVSTKLTKQTGDTTEKIVFSENAIRNSTVPTSYNIMGGATHNVLSADSGSLTLELGLDFDPSYGWISIRMVRLDLAHD